MCPCLRGKRLICLRNEELRPQPSQHDQLKAWSQPAQMMDDASLSYYAHLLHKQPRVLTDLQTKHEVFLLSALESHQSYREKPHSSLPHLGKEIKIRYRGLVIVRRSSSHLPFMPRSSPPRTKTGDTQIKVTPCQSRKDLLFYRSKSNRANPSIHTTPKGANSHH